jgi:hypothetical protein
MTGKRWLDDAFVGKWTRKIKVLFETVWNTVSYVESSTVGTGSERVDQGSERQEIEECEQSEKALEGSSGVGNRQRQQRQQQLDDAYRTTPSVCSS